MTTARVTLTISSRAQLRREIEEQVQHYLRGGGRIEILQTRLEAPPRPIGPVWWDSRGSGAIAPQD
jgi:hypothetical protein